MTFYNIKDGKLEKLPGADAVPKQKIAWLIDRIVLHDDILSEKLMVFSSDPYLLALDKYGALVVVLVFERTVDAQDVARGCDLAWKMRHISYDKINQLAGKHFTSFGVYSENINRLHARHFNIRHSIKPRRFNETQRIIILAPGYDQPSIDSICWHRSEIDISAYTFNLVDIDNNDRLLMMQPTVKWGALKSVMAAIGGLPSAIGQRAFRRHRKDTGL